MKRLLFLTVMMILICCNREETQTVQQSTEPKYTPENIAGTWKATHYDSPNDNLGWVAEPQPPVRKISFTATKTFSTDSMPVVWNNGYVFTGGYELDLTGKLHANSSNQQGIDFSVEFSDASNGIITFFDASTYQNIMQYKIVK